MAKTDYKSIDEYIAAHDADEQKVLQKMRETIHKAVPEVEEVISYQVPAFKYNGWIFYFGAYTNHYSISCPPPFLVFLSTCLLKCRNSEPRKMWKRYKPGRR